MKYKVKICRFPYGSLECSEGVDWLVRTSCKIASDPRFELSHLRIDDTPITMTRNRALRVARDEGADLLLWLDSDIAPDVELGRDPAARPFWDTAVEFVLDSPTPCVVGAPYCGPPPVENVYVFQWGTRETECPDPDGSIEQYTREQAAQMAGFHRAAALPTGLMLIDVRALKRIPPPWTYYEWKGAYQDQKASTEDVTFTRDLSLAGVPLYCAWDSWAGHVKRKVVRKPRPMTADMVAARMHEAIVAGRDSREVLVEVRPTGSFAAKAAEAPPANGPARPAEAAPPPPAPARRVPLTLGDLFGPGGD